MKKIIKITFLGLFLVAATGTTFAQSKNKLAHINSNDLLLSMPERKNAETALQAEAQKLEAQLGAMTKEYQGKIAEYQSQQATMSNLIKETKAGEIQDLEGRIQSFQTSAQQALQEKESELLEPLIEKAKKAIDEVADENGFTYVFDSSMGILLHMPEADDILPLVKKKMGIVTQ